MFQILFKRKKSGIAFGGGAVRGFAHIGVVKALEEHNLEFDYVVGNSAGSIIGALYALGRSWQEMREIAAHLTRGDVISLNFHRQGLFNSEKLGSFLEQIFDSATFEQLRRPFRCVAVNLYDGQLVELSQGPLAPAVRASCCLPGFFTPTLYEDKLLIDGGILNSVPADILVKMGACFRVAINLNADRGYFVQPKSGMDVVYSALKITWNENTINRLRDVDVVIAPELRGIKYHEFKQLDALIELGEQAALQQIERIRKGLKQRFW